MRLLSFFVAAGIVLSAHAAKTLNPKGPPCPNGNGLYAVGCSNKYLECVNGAEFERSCPEGLYFDRLLARCERRSTNFLCKEQATRKTLNVRQKAVTIDCVGRKAGDYPLDKDICNQVYYQCANGISYMRKCPYNQLFSVHLKRCDYETNCYSYTEAKLSAASAYSSPTYDADNFVVTAEEVEQESKGINCTFHGDATISDLTCSPYFYQCANGKLFRKSCPTGLVYVLSQNLCDFPQGVKGCPEYNGSEPSYEQPSQAAPTPAEEYAPTTTQAYVPTTTQGYVPTTQADVPTTTIPPYVEPYVEPSTKPAPIYVPYASAPASPPVRDAVEPEILAKCNNKADGFYEIESCYKNFLACTNGAGRIIACANDLVFDTRINACEFLEICKAPRKQEDVPALHNHGGFLDKKPDEVKVEFDCATAADGHYVKKPCIKEYFRCHDRRAFQLACPADLVYNTKTDTCDFFHNCMNMTRSDPFSQFAEDTAEFVASASHYETVKYSPSETQTSIPYTQPVYTTTQPPTTQPPITQPPTTQQPAQEPAYTQPPTTTVGYEQPTTTKAYTAPTTTVYTTTHAVAPDSFSCASLEDGNYASGPCKSIFYTCFHNQVAALQCPGVLVYNPYNGQCDYEINVPDCRGVDRPLVPPTAFPYTARPTQGPMRAPTPKATNAPVYYVPVKTTTQPPANAPVESYTTAQPPKYAAYCERLADGNYGKKCQPYFFQCANFETTVITCPAGLFYSLKQDRCDHPQNVEGCPGYAPTTTTTKKITTITTTSSPYLDDKYPNIDYTTTTPGPVDTTPIAEAFSCFKRVDGIYALPYCSRDYVQCMAGRSLVASCAAGLYYSERSGLCDYKENIPICRLRKDADSIADDACLGRGDGYFSAGCSSHYFSCIDEQTRKMVCPNKLKFSEKKGICDYPSEVAECGIATKAVSSPPAVPFDFCTIRPNGLHSFGQCSSHYVVCENGRAIAGTCAAPLVFNENNQLCDYKNNNKECGSDYVPPTPVGVESYFEQTSKTQQPYVTVPTTAEYVPTTPTTTTTTTTTTATPASDEPETTTAPYTTTTQGYTQPTTTTKAYTTTTTAPTTTTEAYTTTVPTTTYTQPTTTTTTSAPASDATTTQAYTQPPTTTAQPY